MEELAMTAGHLHGRPAELADALRARTKEPQAFDDVDFHLGRMDRQGVEVSVLSLLGSFCWIEAQPLEVSVPLCRIVNDRLSAICQEHPGRFPPYAPLPLTDISPAAPDTTPALPPPPILPPQLP